MKKFILAIAVAAFMFTGAGLAVAGNGAKVFKKKCKSCHDVGTKKKVGPGFKGVFGRKSKTKGMKGYLLDEAGIRAWLKDPKKIFKKSKMAKLFKKKLKAKEVDAVIEYMKTL